MIISLEVGFWICLCCVGVLFLGFCFFPGFLESVMCVCVLACFPGILTYAAGVFTGLSMPAGVDGILGQVGGRLL